MFTPSKLDSTKKYPDHRLHLPGPQSGSVGPRSFSPRAAIIRRWRSSGSSSWRSTAWARRALEDVRDTYYGNMGDNTIPIRWRGSRSSRSGIRSSTARRSASGALGRRLRDGVAMFKFTDFFDVGIAESGNHDNRNYEDDWGERYQGCSRRTATTDNYAAEANETYAKDLKGKLMLVHGRWTTTCRRRTRSSWWTRS
jgi:hypothetical protein